MFQMDQINVPVLGILENRYECLFSTLLPPELPENIVAVDLVRYLFGKEVDIMKAIHDEVNVKWS